VLVDTHCHLDSLEDLDGVLDRMRSASVGRVVTIGVDGPSSEWAAETANAHPDVWATVGLHPHDAKDRTDDLMTRLRVLAGDARVVGVGETGLDYHYDHSPRDVQRDVFAEQIALAKETGNALVIHTREAWDDTFAILEREGIPERTVFHCWSGDAANARRASDMGCVLSFSGTVTFRNADDLRDAARVTPLDRIVVETDAPFLTPIPHRGKRNEPAYVRHVAELLATIKDVDLDTFAEQTTRNAARLFGWNDG